MQISKAASEALARCARNETLVLSSRLSVQKSMSLRWMSVSEQDALSIRRESDK
jgi:hypothetical protein